MLTTPGVLVTFLGCTSASQSLDPIGKGSGWEAQGKILLKVVVLVPSGFRGAQMRCLSNC